jgi:xanthine dehydrogenase YagS FAD-binding subunit
MPWGILSMRPFQFIEGRTIDSAIHAVGADPQAVFFAGGTTLVDLMKLDVMTPGALVDINRVLPDSVVESGGKVQIGANVRNSDLAWHGLIRERFPVLSEAILAGASAQLRNMASTGGNILQKTRCPYFREAHAACNKRSPGSGCDALTGYSRSHAVLGTSESCIATHPSDMCVALAMLDAVVSTQQANGNTRRIPFNGFHLLPGQTPHRETVLEHAELILGVEIEPSRLARHSHYLKVRDRASYEFALASAAVALDLEGGTIRAARVALGGVATKPWRSREAEAALTGQRATKETFRAAADAAFAEARPRRDNAFKIELGKCTLVRALEELCLQPS